MSKTRTILIGLAGASLFLTSAAAMAQPPQGRGEPGVERGQGRAGPRGGANPEQRAQRLHEQLGITQAQEAAFQGFVAATQRGPESRPDPEAMRDLTTPQRLQRQLTELQGRITATNRLYAVLSAEQKATFDDLPPGLAMGGGGGRGGPGAMAARGGRGGPDGEGGGRRGPRENRGVPGAYDPQ